MSPKAQREALADSVPGWRVGDKTGMSGLVHWLESDGTRMLSDPLLDLNAMHEAEKTLTEKQLNLHVGNLARALIDSKDGSVIGQQMWRATAAQRAEALLRTIGKLDDSK